MTAIIMLTSISLSTMFMFLSHPLSFGLILLIQTMIISTITGMMSYNFWFSYILFLIMVGGMLVLFIYMTSVASNEKFKFSSKLTMFMLSLIIFMLSVIMIDQLFFNMNLFNYDLSPNPTKSYLYLTKYINYPTNMIMISVITYLLITLIMVVKITNIQYGPLRQKI